MKRTGIGILIAVLVAMSALLAACGGSGAGETQDPEAGQQEQIPETAEVIDLPEAPVTDAELIEAMEVYERAAQKYDASGESEERWSTAGMTRIHVSYGKSHATVFFADKEHVLALNYAYDRKSSQYFYAYSALARLSGRGMKDQVTERVPAYNTVPENNNWTNSSWWWVSDSLADLERLYRGKEVNARIELRNSEGETWWFYCQDEIEAKG